MHYPVNVFVGKVRDYDGSRPSAIGKIQVDGELTLGDLGLEGDEQAEKKIHGGPDRALCHYPREHYAHWARELPQQADLFCAPAFGENLSTEGLTEKKRLHWRYLPLGRSADSGHAAAIAVLQAQLSLCRQRYGAAYAKQRQNRLAVSGGGGRAGVQRCAAGAGFPAQRRERSRSGRHRLADAV